MKVWKLLGDGLAMLSVAVAAFGLVVTLTGLEARNWKWSSAMLTLSVATSCLTVLLLALSFRRPSRYRAVYISIALVIGNLLLYLLFERNPRAF
jgi:hypothetical protein